MNRRLLVLELWGLGDLALASTFLRAASARFDVTLVAKPFAVELRPYLWPSVEVIPFTAPWTAARDKYQLHHWPWSELHRLRRSLVALEFDVGVSARWDPRDAAVLALTRSRLTIGYARRGSQFLLGKALQHARGFQHRYDEWQGVARELGIVLPDRDRLVIPRPTAGKVVLVHVGASHPLRVWNLDRYREIVRRLRALGLEVIVACDPGQQAAFGGNEVVVTGTIPVLLDVIKRAAIFIGNDSGPGHVAAAYGVPTLTIFGNNLPELFQPAHQAAESITGKPCEYKPCWDACRFAEPHCITQLGQDEVWDRLREFVRNNLGN